MQPQKRIIKTYIHAGKNFFDVWLNSLQDVEGSTAVARRIARASEGNFGDHRAVGGGVLELRVHCGPGYRVYYGEDGPVIVLLICAGTKNSQKRDIRLAKRLWQEYRRTI